MSEGKKPQPQSTTELEDTPTGERTSNFVNPIKAVGSIFIKIIMLIYLLKW